ncbi:UNVERIFIED_ORG: hypothetical protein B2H98_06495 [Clostridium botulinum]
MDNKLIDRFQKKSPAKKLQIDKLQELLDCELPKDYINFMLSSNGGEGWIGQNSYLMLWRLEDILELNIKYNTFELIPGLLIFGSNGGIDAYAFDTRLKAIPIVNVPFIGMNLNEVNYIGDTFEEFLENLYNSN